MRRQNERRIRGNQLATDAFFDLPAEVVGGDHGSLAVVRVEGRLRQIGALHIDRHVAEDDGDFLERHALGAEIPAHGVTGRVGSDLGVQLGLFDQRPEHGLDAGQSLAVLLHQMARDLLRLVFGT